MFKAADSGQQLKAQGWSACVIPEWERHIGVDTQGETVKFFEGIFGKEGVWK